MFSLAKNSKFALLCSKNEYGKAFMFEATLYWAEKSERVFYITAEPLSSFPATYHDRNISPTIFNLIKFLYLANYEALIQQLIDLHTFQNLPTIIIIENLDIYINDTAVKERNDIHTARLCAVIHNCINACMSVKKSPIHFLSTTNLNINSAKHNSNNNILQQCTCLHYFNCIWFLRDRTVNDEVIVELNYFAGNQDTFGDVNSTDNVFVYHLFDDKTLILDRILQKIHTFNN